MIPNDWTINEIGDLIKLETGISVNAEDRTKAPHEFGVLKVSAVSYGKFDPTAYKTISDISECRVRIIPKADSVLISRANTFELVGASAYIDSDYPDLFLPDKLWQSVHSSKQLSIRWLSYALSTERIRHEIKNRATGTSGSMKNISQDSFLSIQIAVPPSQEQHKIAEILSTWDKAIDLTEQQIAAQQKRKQALMHQLLTGKTRFPGFKEVWKEYQLGELASLTAGGTPSTKVEDYWGGNIRWMNSGEINLRYVHEVEGRITQPGLDNSSTKLIPPNSVMIALAGQGKTRGMVAINKIETATNQSIAAIMPIPTKLYYLFLFFNLDSRYSEMRSLSGGDGGRGGLNLSILKNVTIFLPSLAEQKKIADVLYICDEELSLLSQKLAALRQQKKGLMQQLLTGKIRVKI